jgi:hypothetical protein
LAGSTPLTYSHQHMQSLVERFCPNVHDAPVTAAAFDPASGTVVTADASGVVAVQRTGEASPRLVFHPGEAVNGALAVIRGGSLIAVGDESGTVGVYQSSDGASTFQEVREGARGRVRAMRGLALNPEGSRLAAIAADGLLRVWDLTRNERNAWRGFGGDTVSFDQRGERILAIDDTGQPRLMDLTTLEALYMDKLQTPATKARFTPCGTMVLAGGSGSINLLRVADGALIASFATQGGSGIQNLLTSPDGTRAAAVTQRSCHIFSLPELDPLESFKHGAPNPTGAGVWHSGGLRIAGADGLMHGGGSGSLGPVDGVAGTGAHRVLMHGDVASVWKGEERVGLFKIDGPVRAHSIDRAGRLLVTQPLSGPIKVYQIPGGKPLFDGGRETKDTERTCVGGEVVAVQLKGGGTHWWHLKQNRGFSLPWPTFMALSGSGTWLGVVTPGGAVHIIDPTTGKDAVNPPQPLSDSPVQLIDFVNRCPELLILDKEGVLGHYDLTESVQKGTVAVGRDVLAINVPVDRIWGITGGSTAALRLPEGDRCTILWIDLHQGEVIGEVRDLPGNADVDDENSRILIPARAGGLLELSREGKELRVLRDLPDQEWISFGENGIMGASKQATSVI